MSTIKADFKNQRKIEFSHTVFLLFFFVLTTVNTLNTNAQCVSESFMNSCSAALDEFNFIKSYELENKKEDVKEYSYVFSKGSVYRIIICDENKEGSRLIITLFDRNKKKIASNYDTQSKKYFSTIIYPCSATGIYFVKYEYESKKSKCAVNILGFSKQ